MHVMENYIFVALRKLDWRSFRKLTAVQAEIQHLHRINLCKYTISAEMENLMDEVSGRHAWTRSESLSSC